MSEASERITELHSRLKPALFSGSPILVGGSIESESARLQIQSMQRHIERSAEREAIRLAGVVEPLLAERDAEIARLSADNDRLQRAILSWGNNPAGFDWAVLGKIDEQDQEIERLRAENERLNMEIERIMDDSQDGLTSD